MLGASQIRERFAARPEVAEWILAVREELESGLGEVGTLSRFAQLVKAKRPKCSKTVDQLRRRASEQLTTRPGPSSKLAEYVLAFVVPDDRRAEVTRRFAELYAAAHGEPAPFAATAPQPEPAPAAVEAIPAGSATTGELRELVTELRQMIRAAEQREAVVQAELAVRTEEADRLRVNLSAVNLVATAPRRRAAGSIGAPDGAGPPAAPHVPPPRDDRYDSLATLNEPLAGTRWKTAADLDLESYWLGGLWNDLHHRPAAGDGLDPRQVASTFGVIARTLSREGVGAGVGEPAPEDSATSPADEQPPQTGCQTARERAPREWTSQGPPWFYALLGALVTVGVLGVPLALLIALNAPAAPPEDDNNFVVTLINERYP
jgi:hypothetical protein